MLFGLTYATVRRAGKAIGADPEEGLDLAEIRKVGRKLRRPLKVVPFDPEDRPTGLLCVREKRDHHIVVMFQGVVIDPSDGSTWDLDTYLTTGKGK